MAHPKISKMVTRRQRQCELVEWFLRVHRREVAESLDLFLRQIGVPGWNEDDGTPPDVEAFLDRLGGRLKGALNDLLEAEQRHLDELANDAEPRQRRDHAAEELRDDLFHLRDLFRGAYGRAAAEEIGFEKRIASEPLSLSRQGERAAARLRDPEPALPKPRFEGIEIPAECAAEALEGTLARLREALDDVTREQAQTQGRRIAKDLAMKHFDAAFRPIVRILKSSFRLAGYPELAARIPSSLRRQARAASQERREAASVNG